MTELSSSPLLADVAAPRSTPAVIGAVILVALIAAVVFFARLGFDPLNDWDEAWHAEVSSEILATGDWLTLHDRGGLYFNKPPLTFWLRAVAFKLSGENEATARFFPALFSWGSAVAMAWFVARLFNPAAGLLSGLILCSSWLFTMHHAGRSGETDGTLIFFLTLAVICLWKARTHPRWCYAAGVATGLGWMTKGGTIYLAWIACLTAVAIERPKTGWRWRHAVGGLLLGFLLTVPWQAIMLIRFGRPFINMFYIGEGALPALTVTENHPGSWLFYLTLFHQYVQPWLVLALAAIAGKIVGRRDPSPGAMSHACVGMSSPFADMPARAWDMAPGSSTWPGILWLTTWALVVFAACTAFATKMTWYATPALPPLAALAAVAGVDLARKRFGWVVLIGVAVFGVMQSRRQFWDVTSVGAAAALVVAAAGSLKLPPARSVWHPMLAALLLAAPLAQHFAFLHGLICKGVYFTGDMELRTLDEPWREFAARLRRQPHRSVIVAVDLPAPLDPASYFYLKRLHPPSEMKPITMKEVANDRDALHGMPVISRIEQVEELEALGFKEVLREGSLVEMRRQE